MNAVGALIDLQRETDIDKKDSDELANISDFWSQMKNSVNKGTKGARETDKQIDRQSED